MRHAREGERGTEVGNLSTGCAHAVAKACAFFVLPSRAHGCGRVNNSANNLEAHLARFVALEARNPTVGREGLVVLALAVKDHNPLGPGGAASESALFTLEACSGHDFFQDFDVGYNGDGRGQAEFIRIAVGIWGLVGFVGCLHRFHVAFERHGGGSGCFDALLRETQSFGHE